jgi:hypothetical protein
METADWPDWMTRTGSVKPRRVLFDLQEACPTGQNARLSGTEDGVVTVRGMQGCRGSRGVPLIRNLSAR